MSQKKIIVFALCLAGLLALQIKFVLPLLQGIAASDLFLVESKDDGSSIAISNEMTNIAFTHCNSYISKELGPEISASFASKPTNAWSLGNYEYIINAELELPSKDGANTTHHYVCRIQYSKGDDLSGINDIDNWSLDGLTGIPGL
ncbi:MAG: hypothetical protein CTY22_03240 [Methylomonas sp.]|nr:MAG: hypothetical protein CTY23_03005 [Methylomonas sp.]PPD26972.1 MAG: hypothetical protein CTY22_03240 [Methylomonas sp.]PPD38910.1 MAG: hypothetical protein CTY21_03235 [Methylomonas sp.]PPD42606.1 MAG: hypothetical protein CTY17_01185 [Methylomonas sp.]PPD54123.1 MAG: hypothetical protein CTY11_04070 [Methylomonas sp.]